MGTRLSTYTVDTGQLQGLFVMDCATCAVVYAISAEMEERRRDDGKSWYCPNGHSQVFSDSEASRQKKRAENLEQRLKWAESREARQRQEREAAERSARAFKGQVTRLRNRIAAGACPVQGCRRNFANVTAHIKGQHPEWASEHPEVLS